ncbi:vesicular-fusion protein S17 [Quaeritorhiza haematococci]|nr:vesicular-fusion protein S17 [Quaeritorhiza haematococci]
MSEHTSEREAVQLLAQADKKAKQTGWFGGNKADEAAELYAKAANSFKLAKKWKEAGDAYLQQAGCLIRIGEADEAASAYINASKAYKKSNPHESVTALKSAVGILTEKGRFHSAANNQKQIAEMYETDLDNQAEAMQAYETAAEWFQLEDSNAQVNACLLKVATIGALLGQYDKAIEKFEDVASKSVDNNLTKWSVREYLLKAGLCLICTQDYVRARTSLERYTNMDVTFSGTREYKFLVELLDAIEAGDKDQFTLVCQDYDRLTKLDNWKTSLLLKAKKSIEDEPDFT